MRLQLSLGLQLICFFSSINTILGGEGTLEDGVLEIHNLHRERAGLKPLKWSTSLAKTSTRWANENLKDEYMCSGLRHSPSGSEYRPSNAGENIYGRGGSKSYSEYKLGLKGSHAWYSEIKNYKWPGEGEAYLSCPSVHFPKVGHFTQMMWSTTTQVGCGIANCEVNTWQYLVCQYNPSGNWQGKAMFGQNNLDKLRKHEILPDCETLEQDDGRGSSDLEGDASQRDRSDTKKMSIQEKDVKIAANSGSNVGSGSGSKDSSKMEIRSCPGLILVAALLCCIQTHWRYLLTL